MSKFSKATASVLVAAVLAVGLAGCSEPGAKPTSSKEAVSVDATAAKLLPLSAKTRGLTVGSEIPYAPMEFYDSAHKPAGFEVDLIAAIAAKLGIRIAFQEQSFDAIIPALQAGKHDLAVSSMSDTTDRQKALDFIDYFNGGASLIVNKGNPAKVTGLSGLCGQSVAAESASWEIDVLAAASAECLKANKPAITTAAFPSDANAQTALRAQKVSAYLSDSQAAAYSAKVAGNGKYFDLLVDKAYPTGYESGLIGVGILKTNKPVRNAVFAALKDLFKDGTYGKLLAKWNLASFAVAQPTINGTK